MLCFRGLLAAFLLPLLLAACGGGGGGSTQGPSGGTPPPGSGDPPPPPVTNRSPTVQISSFTTNEDATLTAHITATDPDGDALTFTRTSDPQHGVIASFDSARGDFTYQPTANVNGADAFAIRVADTAGNTVNATIAIAIQAVNDVPVTADAELQTTDDVTVVGRIVASDADATALTFAAAQSPAHGTVSVTAADGSFSYRPDGVFVGEDSFSIRATDPEGAAALANVRIVVTSSALSYAGSSTQTVITEANAVQVARTLWTQLTRLIASSEASAKVSTTALPAQVDTTLNGAKSGTARLIGAIDAAGAGRVQIQYANYVQETLSLNGLQILDLTGHGEQRYSFKKTSLRLGGVSAIASGSLTFTAATPGPGTRITGDLKVVVDGQTHWLRDIDLLRRESVVASTAFNDIPTIAWSGGATLFDPAQGYVTLEFDEPLDFFSTQGTLLSRTDRPVGRGGPTAVGASQARLWISMPGFDYAAVELDLAGRNIPSRSLAFRIDEDFEQPAGHDASHALQAAASYPIDNYNAVVGRPFFLEGRLSEQRDGHFLSHRWFIDSAPAGSHPALTNADSTRPSLTADQPGDYLLRLEVDDGTSRSTDYVIVGADTLGLPTGVYIPPSFGRIVAGAEELVEPGTEVTLDARKSSQWESTTWSSLGYVWSVRAPDGTYPMLKAPGQLVRFVPSQPGTYQASFHAPDYMPRDLFTKPIHVRPSVRFSPAVSLKPDITGSSPFARDIDGDGLIDVISPRHDIGALTLFRRLPDGRFAAGVMLEDPDILGRFYLEDVTGDGRLDIIRHIGNTFSVAVQTPAGSFAPAVTLDDGTRVCGTFFLWEFQGVVDVDRDGRADIVRTLLCDSTRWMVVNRSPGGTFGAGEELAIPDSASLTGGAAGDIDGDGDLDLVGLPPFNSSPYPAFLNVLRLAADGTFAPATIPLPEPLTPGYLHLRDLNGDHRLDIVGLRDPILVLIQNPDGTFTERGRVPGRTPFSSERPERYFADVTNDGRMDIVLPASPGTGPRLIEQLPDGRFVERVPYDAPNGALIDINLDGRMDVVGNNNSVSIQAPP